MRPKMNDSERELFECRGATIKEQAAEIERLKETNEQLMRNATQDAEREHRKDVLITDLAAALFDSDSHWLHQDLLQKAREATRDDK